MKTQIKERPILFSAPMVRALLDGSKTQTRRVVRGQTYEWQTTTLEEDIHGCEFFVVCGAKEAGGLRPILAAVTCPYGRLGDHLWVRETWGVVSNAWDGDGNLTDWTPDRPAAAIHEMRFGQGYYSGHVIYAADGSYEWAGDDDGGGEPRSAWHPSIHMPRVASRILLEIVSVRVERLTECSETDAYEEGAQAWAAEVVKDGNKFPSVQAAYRALWESINGAGSWAANPWVWAVEFKVVAQAPREVEAV